MKKRYLLSFVCLLAFALISSTANSAGEVEYIIEKDFNKMTPVYMVGHGGDPAWIEGFAVGGNIFFNGSKVGTVTGDVWLWNPPMVLGAPYAQVGMLITNTITGLGTFEVHAQGVALGSSTSAAKGDVTVSWSGSVANGTGFFNNRYGLSAGAITANNFKGTGSGSEIVLLRNGF